ncbi:hypothetical protein [Paenibacillus sp. L3-i20]|nr:hypothetical protein [Paenibacillus sp. L3-i20]GKU78023.1 hypothetical protein L3i20_v224200 [Paenibacillus sp. L3-i20]
MCDNKVFELNAIAYDWEAAAQRAEENERDDYAFAIRTGKAIDV